jgi:hypothetical protein
MAHSPLEGLTFFSQLLLKTDEVFQEARRNCLTLVVYHAKKFLNIFAYSTRITNILHSFTYTKYT